MNKNYFLYLLILISLLLLILFPDVCVNGAKSGLLLWFNTVIPTLFPFFLVSRLIIRLQMWPKSLFNLYPYFIGLLAGYPNGAMAVYEAVQSKNMDKETAASALVICNNASPIFLISYIGLSSLHEEYNKYVIWFLVIISSFITSFIIKIYYHIKKPVTNATGFDINNIVIQTNNTSKNILEDVIMKSCEILVIVGAYIIIFSIYAAFITMLPLNNIHTATLSGMFEITCGINLISEIDISAPIKYILTACIAGFGGLSSAFQSKKYITESGLSFFKYIIHKAISAIICMIFMYLYIMIQAHQ